MNGPRHHTRRRRGQTSGRCACGVRAAPRRRAGQMQHRSILDLFLANAEGHPDATAAMVKRGGAYQDVTWKELADAARATAAGLVSLGVQPGDRVSIISQTRVEWVTADLGILGAGAVTVPV